MYSQDTYEESVAQAKQRGELWKSLTDKYKVDEYKQQTLEIGAYNLKQKYVVQVGDDYILFGEKRDGIINPEGILVIPNQNAIATLQIKPESPFKFIGKFTGFKTVPMNDGSESRLGIWEGAGLLFSYAVVDISKKE